MNVAFLALQTQATGGLTQFLPIILIVVVFWLFIIRPQMKKQKELNKFRESLAKGDKIITTGGIYGKVLEINTAYVIIEVEGQNRLKVDKSAIIKDMSDVTTNTKK